MSSGSSASGSSSSGSGNGSSNQSGTSSGGSSVGGQSVGVAGPGTSAVSGGNTTGSLQLPAENVGTTPAARRGPAYLVWLLAAVIVAGFGVLYRRFPRRAAI